MTILSTAFDAFLNDIHEDQDQDYELSDQQEKIHEGDIDSYLRISQTMTDKMLKNRGKMQ